VPERDVLSRVFELEGLCQDAFDAAPMPEQPDTEAIEALVLRCYPEAASGPDRSPA